MKPRPSYVWVNADSDHEQVRELYMRVCENHYHVVGRWHLDKGMLLKMGAQGENDYWRTVSEHINKTYGDRALIAGMQGPHSKAHFLSACEELGVTVDPVMPPQR